MYQPIQPTDRSQFVRNSINRSPLPRGLLLVALALAWCALSPAARAVSPAPDGGYPNQNTAEGDNALLNLTTGIHNTAIGFQALLSNTTGSLNTALGYNALFSSTTGGNNTAIGHEALALSTAGGNDTAIGFEALALNTNGGNNTAVGVQALFSNTSGGANTANGFEALMGNTTGFENTADGFFALNHNTTGGDNTAEGWNALVNNTSGNGNIALGVLAGSNLTTGSNNIDIGNVGVAGESNRIRIGTKGTQTGTLIAGISGVTVPGGVGVIIDTNGRLGTVVSSARFKDAIQPMDRASEAILALKPVTFRYTHELDPEGIPQFGLVAEQVEKVNPDLVACDEQGKPYTVRYEAVNAMLLNEFLKEHRKVEEQEATITQLKAADTKLGAMIMQQQKQFQATITQQHSEITALTAAIETQAAQIQKVNERLATKLSSARLTSNDQ